jgi:hypothetical protein
MGEGALAIASLNPSIAIVARWLRTLVTAHPRCHGVDVSFVVLLSTVETNDPLHIRHARLFKIQKTELIGSLHSLAKDTDSHNRTRTQPNADTTPATTATTTWCGTKSCTTTTTTTTTSYECGLCEGAYRG